MTDKEKIISEIERRYNQNNDKLTKIPEYCDEASILRRVCAEDLYFRDFINSLPTEMPSEDFKKAAEEYASMSQIAYKGIHCTYVDDQHAFIAGADWQKEQMMKNCLYDTEVMLHTKQNNTEYLTLANDKLPHVPVSCGLNVGDKVKILIIKEDEQ